MKTTRIKVLVVGATGGSGRAAIRHLLDAGHEVTAFARRADRIDMRSPRLRFFNGDAMNAGDIDRAVPGHDAVVVTLGITENPLRVRFFGPARTPLQVRSAGTRHVIAAMKRHGVRKLVVQTTYGVGPTRARLGWQDRLFFALLLKPQIADTEIENAEVSASGLDWVIVQPVHLTDGDEDGPAFVSTEGQIGQLKVSRNRVGRVLAEAAVSAAHVGACVSVSGPPVVRPGAGT